MKTVRTLTLAAVFAGVTVEAMHNGTPQGEVIEMLPNVARGGTCTELPKLCTGPVVMYGFVTTVTYLCPETTRGPSTVHVTITKTTTVTPPPEAATTNDVPDTSMIPISAPILTSADDITTTIHSTLTKYKTITVVGNTDAPSDATTPPAAISITEYVSATIPTELSPITHATRTDMDEPAYTVQTSRTPASMPASDHGFPLMSPSVINGITTGIFYTAPIANSSALQPTPLFPNTTSTHSYHALPTFSVVNRAPETKEATNSAAGKLSASLTALAFGVMLTVFTG